MGEVSSVSLPNVGNSVLGAAKAAVHQSSGCGVYVHAWLIVAESGESQ